MNGIIRLVNLTVLISCTICSFAQQGQALTDRLARKMQGYLQKQNETSVYLKCDKDIYIAGEDLWFSAFVLDARSFSLSGLDRILYLQLVQKGRDSVVWKEMYPVTNGVSGGHVYLPPTLPEGDYLLKACTAHSCFSGRPFFYAVAPVQVVRDLRSIQHYASLAQSVSLQKGEPVRLDFFPEGGTLVAGLPGRLAFKALNKDGLPVNISGALLKNGVPVLPVTTTHAGMGSIMFTPEAHTVYTVKIDNSRDSVFSIPPVAEEGVVMRLEENNEDSLVFKIAARQAGAVKVLLGIQVRGLLQSIAAGTLKDSLVIKIPVAGMPAGIAAATLFNEQLQPVARRLVFVRQENRLHICFTGIKEQHYAPKEQVSVKIKTTDSDGKPVPAVLNFRVYDQLFANRKNVRDMVNYYQLSTQLGDVVYDPSYYFEHTSTNSRQAMDVLLLAQPVQNYHWSEESLARDTAAQRRILSDSLQAFLLPVNKHRKDKTPVSLLLFNYNKSITQVGTTDNNGLFYITPENLSIGQRFFVKYFSGNDYDVRVTNPFDTLQVIEQRLHPVYILAEKNIVMEDTTIDTSRLQYGQLLEEVVVKAKGRGFGDRYLGYLDSIAKFEGNTDYVGQCGWLNCPACSGGTKPVEGRMYSELVEPKRSQVNSHPFSFTETDMRKVVYHYPKYTEEELLKKFKMAVVKGFSQHKAFYAPDYDIQDKTVPDTRNTLFWNPMIVTDANGEAIIRFFCSDIHSRFTGVAEGVGEEGVLGVGTFDFSVK
jgi:hypothetical protein